MIDLQTINYCFDRIHRVEISFEIWSTASQGNSLSFSTFLVPIRDLLEIKIKRILFVNTKWKFKNVWYLPEILWPDERKKKNIKDDSLLKDKLRDICFVLRFFVTSHNPLIYVIFQTRTFGHNKRLLPLLSH